MLNWLRRRLRKKLAVKPVLKQETVKVSKPAKWVKDIALDNEVSIDATANLKGSIVIKGQGNRVSFAKGVTFKGDLTIEGNHNEITLGRECVVRGRLLLKGKKQQIVIGEKTTFGSVYILCQEGCNVHIGRWCMFSRDIEIRTTDAHSVVDVSSRKRLNTPESVVIGDHVWVGVGALLSKGTVLANDSIVGAFSFVNTVFTEENIIVAGTPAKLVKRGVTWQRGRKASFTEEELNRWRLELDSKVCL
ncbi:hypothetical protein [Vibrio metschnikovii]|uniref:acyltransferase n=1 Tax=Vibrio metschnikovii TaxID=28172 RepID=UPI00315C7D8F